MEHYTSSGYAPRGIKGQLGWGGDKPPLLITVFREKLKKKFERDLLFSRGDFSYGGCGTLPQNSYKPYQVLWEATM